MIVDDSIFNLEALKIILKPKFPYELDTANNGKEAFEMFEARHKAALEKNYLDYS